MILGHKSPSFALERCRTYNLDHPHDRLLYPWSPQTGQSNIMKRVALVLEDAKRDWNCKPSHVLIPFVHPFVSNQLSILNRSLEGKNIARGQVLAVFDLTSPSQLNWTVAAPCTNPSSAEDDPMRISGNKPGLVRLRRQSQISFNGCPSNRVRCSTRLSS